ncbi:MAG: hypothetical protein JNL08_17490 [Planctomycetes bacterium]|nr:hypothetical protein [Planctomycetota bacterium]
MTSAHMTAPSLQQLAPNVTARVKDGDLALAPLVLLGIGAALVGAAWATGGHDFYGSYLVGYMGVLGICLGALFFTMLQHITRAGWSTSVRRLAENTSAALPLMALLFVPVIVGWKDLYHHWAHANHAADGTPLQPGDAGYDAVLAGKEGWLNPTFFFVRVGIYFLIWVGLATYFRRASLKQDETGDPAISLRLSRVAAPGLLLFALSTTFAAFDWIMSIDPHWFSTIFGLTYFAGAFMAFLAFTILIAKWLGKKGYLREAITVEHYHDLGKLLFTFMVFWTYTNFSQYMLIWYANLPEETRWFADRAEGGWGAVGTILVFGHFFVPFAFLLSRHVKRNSVALSIGAIFLLVIHCFDMQFLILPALRTGEHAADHAAHAAGHGEGVAVAIESGLQRFPHDLATYLHGVGWADFGCFLGLLAVVAGFTLMNVRRSNLLPVRDPRLAESLHFQNF